MVESNFFYVQKHKKTYKKHIKNVYIKTEGDIYLQTNVVTNSIGLCIDHSIWYSFPEGVEQRVVPGKQILYNGLHYFSCINFWMALQSLRSD